MSVDAFYSYARERYQTMLNKDAGLPQPWTQDKILQEFRFCNVFREDDKVTKWIRQNVTHEKYGSKLLGAMVIARWFNRIETLELMLPPKGCSTPYFEHNLFYSWDIDLEKWKRDMVARLSSQSPLVTGAYMIKTPAKMNKLDGIIWCLEQFLPHAHYNQQLVDQIDYTLENATKALMQFPYLGAFMAYEVITDMRHTPVLCNAPDIMLWANPGPGCARGLARVLGMPVNHFNRHNAKQVDVMMSAMRGLLEVSKDNKHWPSDWPQWEMRDIEHTLCEFDKYERARLGEGRPKQKYKPEN